ncbi:RHS repeat-associated core domain-containing protein [Streptomyces zhihengii]
MGKTEDSSTGLVHIGARAYDLTVGQFISVDPVLMLTQHQSLNGYAYANNSPVTFADPTGMCIDPETGAASLTTAGRTRESRTRPTTSIRVTQTEMSTMMSTLKVPTRPFRPAPISRPSMYRVKYLTVSKKPSRVHSALSTTTP